MLKTHYRDYATEAYRLHARLGSAAAYKRRVLAEALARRYPFVECCDTEG